MRKNQITKFREVNSNPAARRGNGTINFNIGQTLLNNSSFPHLSAPSFSADFDGTFYYIHPMHHVITGINLQLWMC